jgi:hypothetical protein
MNWEATYSQVHLFAKAMAECGSDHIYPLSTALRGSQFDAPQGVFVLISLISIPGYIRALVWQMKMGNLQLSRSLAVLSIPIPI